MKALLQRVSRASVRVEGELVGEIGPGLLVLLGVAQGDTEEEARYLADRVAGLRIFADSPSTSPSAMLRTSSGQRASKFNLSLRDVGGAALVVSQFTLLADTGKGRRPSFDQAAPPEVAEPLVARFCACLREAGVPVASGRFGTHMEVELVNDGPVTVLVESKGERVDFWSYRRLPPVEPPIGPVYLHPSGKPEHP